MNNLDEAIVEHRTLGKRECLYTIQHELGHGALSIAIAFGIKGPFDERTLRSALNLLYLRHPLLRAVITQQPDEYIFECNALFSDIPIIIQERESDHDWEQLFDKVLSKPLETDKYLWRFYALHSNNTPEERCEFILHIHHAIHDGYSVRHLINEFLINYSKFYYKIPLNFSAQPLLPPLDELMDSSHYDISDAPAATSSPPTPLPYHKTVPLKDRRSQNIHISIDSAETQSLIEKCKNQQTSLNALLNAVYLLTFQRLLNTNLTMQISSPISMRNHCRIALPPENLGCYFVAYACSHDITAQSDIWTVAKEHQLKVKQMIPHAVNFLLSLQDKPIHKLIELIGYNNIEQRQQFVTGYCTLNSELADASRYFENMELLFYFGSASQQAGPWPIAIFGTLLDSKIYLTFSYAHPLTSPEWAKQFVMLFQKTLQSKVIKS